MYSAFGYAQNRVNVSGTVADSSGEPLVGVTIVIKGAAATGSITGIDGKFSLPNVPSDAVLVVSYIGYVTREVPVNGQHNLTIILSEDTKALEEVIVVGYGTQIRRNVTGAMETVKFEELADIPVAQFTQKLQGQIAGVQINQGTGLPGQGMNVRIRGSASLSTASAPLYVVDGFPIVGDINIINPGEIESMTILKDAAATSLYGSRAAFGVVLITTKGAKAGKTKVNVNAYTGFQNVPEKGRADMMNATEWAQFKKEYYEDLGQTVPEAFRNPSQYGTGYDWYDKMLRTAMIQDYSVSVSTGTDRFAGSVVAGFFRQDGVVTNSNFNRVSIRANSFYRISPQLKVSFNIAPTFNFEDRPSTDGAFFSGGGLLANALLTPPIVAYEDEDGEMPVAVTTPGITSFETPNWIRSAKEITNKRENNRLLSNASLEYEPVRNLVLKTSINIDLAQTFHHYFQPSTAGREFAAAPSALRANLQEANNRYHSWLSENTITYSGQIGKHEFDLLGGYTAQQFRSDYSAISGYNYPDDRIQTINAALVKNNPTMDVQQWSMLSYLARINYSYKGRYLFGASIRRDGSSRFGANNKWGNFPSFSAGWIASDEKFLEKPEWLSLLKIRGSYGIIGNNNIGNYTYYNTVNTTANSVFGSTTVSGSAVTGLGNDNLGWEKTTQLDIGIDISFLNNRINFTYDYYNKRTSDLLYSLQIPRESGFSNIMGNVGKLKFWGHEFSVNSHNLVGTFNWNTNFNISFSDNRVLELSGLSDVLYANSDFVSTITRVGGRIGQFYGLIQEGVYVNQADFDGSPKAVDSQVGVIKFKDVNKDGDITFGNGDAYGDKTEIGNPFPKFTFGLTNSFSYRDFDLSIICTGSYGNKIATPTEQATANLDGPFNVLKEVKDRWRSPENPGAGLYGKTTGSTNRERDVFHSRFVKDGSHLTVKNITLGYTLPAALIRGIDNLRIYASVQQAYVFTKYKYANPEVGVDFSGNAPGSLLQGIDYSTYPVPRTFTLGLNITF
ncbi:MAG: TonB-dependent receptor [Tannerella sp.]|jgi:TonB-linked SusC/RagA family outer membrane protein|nr:TonB-dependent receptor [Tannerella sp.]